MTQPNPPPDQTRDTDLREIPKWADRYARNRVLLELCRYGIHMVVAGIMVALIAGAASAWVKGHSALGIALFVANLAFWAWLWLVLSKRLDTWTTAGTAWLYRNEGEAARAAPAMQPTRLDKAVVYTFGALACATPLVSVCSGISLRYLQPVTAAYLVPLIV